MWYTYMVSILPEMCSPLSIQINILYISSMGYLFTHHPILFRCCLGWCPGRCQMEHSCQPTRPCIQYCGIPVHSYVTISDVITHYKNNLSLLTVDCGILLYLTADYGTLSIYSWDKISQIYKMVIILLMTISWNICALNKRVGVVWLIFGRNKARQMDESHLNLPEISFPIAVMICWRKFPNFLPLHWYLSLCWIPTHSNYILFLVIRWYSRCYWS